MAIRKDELEYVQLTELPEIKSHLSDVSKELDISVENAGQHLGLLDDKHDGVAKAKIQIAELARLARRLDGFFIKELARQHHERPEIPKKGFFTTEDKEIEEQGRHALKNIQHNLEELKKHLGLL